jgi:hypothetical protein
VAVASTLELKARERGDDGLAAESGIAALADALRAQVLDGAKQRCVTRSLRELDGTMSQLVAPLRAEVRAIEDPDRAHEMVEQLRATMQRLESLREGGARWSTVLTDGFSDLRSDVDFRLRAVAKDVAWEFEQRLEEIDPGVEWAALGTDLQTRMGEEAAALFEHIDVGAAEIRDRVSAVLHGAGIELSELPESEVLDVEALWSGTERTLSTETPGVLSLGLTALRGGSSGVILLGMIARFASIAAMNPLALGVGVAFGAKQVLDVRARAVKQRRQEARTIQRQFLDQVQLELGNRVRQVVQEAQRSLRDHYVGQIQEVSQTCTSSIASMQESIQRDQQEGPARLEQLRNELNRLDALVERSAGLQDGIGGFE